MCTVKRQVKYCGGGVILLRRNNIIIYNIIILLRDSRDSSAVQMRQERRWATGGAPSVQRPEASGQNIGCFFGAPSVAHIWPEASGQNIGCFPKRRGALQISLGRWSNTPRPREPGAAGLTSHWSNIDQLPADCHRRPPAHPRLQAQARSPSQKYGRRAAAEGRIMVTGQTMVSDQTILLVKTLIAGRTIVTDQIVVAGEVMFTGRNRA